MTAQENQGTLKWGHLDQRDTLCFSNYHTSNKDTSLIRALVPYPLRMGPVKVCMCIRTASNISPAPAGPPTDVEVQVQSPHSVQLTWDPPSPPPLGGVVYYVHWGEEDPDNLYKVMCGAQIRGEVTLPPPNITTPSKYHNPLPPFFLQTEVVWKSTHYTLDGLLPIHTYFLYLVADVSSHLSSPSRLLNVTTLAGRGGCGLAGGRWAERTVWGESLVFEYGLILPSRY